MKSVVTPSILSLTSVDDMNATLNHLIYEYFSSKHGTIQPSKRSMHSTTSHTYNLRCPKSDVRNLSSRRSSVQLLKMLHTPKKT
jgi:hypothetical protein